ncbi:uncharacterized protein [Drosophila bipectinata]|uniref:uncharacterized protein n=1 Tax=Drosophila bipectinata TaxID=42026 RepID=UPI001C894728|nr:uncharacterized protein LOC122321155 [Drosophila bipectinata]
MGSWLPCGYLVRSLSHKIEIECRDLDEITTKEEVSEAIGKLVESPGVPVSDILLRKTFGQTQTAIIRLPATCARKATKIVWLKVGWMRGRLRKGPEFGHIAKQCQRAIDRLRMCKRCGKDGHMAKDCAEEPKCALCSNAGKEAGHITEVHPAQPQPLRGGSVSA